MENVCLSVDDDSFMYAVGSKAHTDLLDARTLQVNRYCNKCSKHSDLFPQNFFDFSHHNTFYRKLETYHHETMAVEYVQCRLKAIY